MPPPGRVKDRVLTGLANLAGKGVAPEIVEWP
jgi:hypothetical protein